MSATLKGYKFSRGINEILTATRNENDGYQRSGSYFFLLGTKINKPFTRADFNGNKVFAEEISYILFVLLQQSASEGKRKR